MRILFFVQTLGVGGLERSVSYLAHGLAQRRHHVVVLGLHTSGPGWQEILDPYRLPVTILFPERPRSAVSAAAQLISATRRLRHLLRAERIECIYCTGGPVPPVVGWLASLNQPHIRAVWGKRGVSSPSSAHPSWRRLLLRQFRIRVAPTVPLMISCSAAAQAAAQAVGYRCQRHVVIYNGVDTACFRPDPAGRAAIRSEWGVPSSRKLIGLVGRLHPSKGHPVFLEAARIMAAARDDLLFVCVGDGPGRYRSHLHQLGAELGLGERLTWAGARRYGEMPAVYSALDVLCLPSSSEAFGNVLIEAMACGVPCVATRVGGIPEAMGDLGIVVPPGEPVALARAVLDTLQAEPRPEVLRKYVIERFSVEAMVSATERELEALLGSGEPK